MHSGLVNDLYRVQGIAHGLKWRMYGTEEWIPHNPGHDQSVQLSRSLEQSFLSVQSLYT